MSIPLYDLPFIPKHPVSPDEIGYLEKYDFFSSDSEKLYVNSLKKLGPRWKYATEKILYEFNAFGMRSPQVTDITDNNFFIVYGCSHTEGIGISCQDRYSDILSKRLNLKFLNAGQGGTSQNYLWTSNILSCKNIKFTPKFVVCQWPDISRLAILNNFSLVDLISSGHIDKSLNTNITNYWKQMVNTPEVYTSQTLGYFHSINQMWSLRGVQVVHFTLDQETHEILGIPKFSIDTNDPYKLARDLWHPGYEMNLKFADYIEQEIKNKR